jgi:hypothetical protein
MVCKNKYQIIFKKYSILSSISFSTSADKNVFAFFGQNHGIFVLNCELLTRLSLPYDLPEASLLHEDENKKNSSEL